MKRKVRKMLAEAVFVWNDGLFAITMRMFSMVTQMRIKAVEWERGQSCDSGCIFVL